MTMPRPLFHWFSWLSSRWILLLISFVLAVVTWAIVNSSQTVKESRRVRLQYVQLSPNLVFHRVPLSDLRIEVFGPLREIRALKPEDLFYVVDLSGVGPGIKRIEVDPELIKRPFDVEIFNIAPRSFNVQLEEKVSRSFPVRVSFVGRPADGQSMTRYTIKPERLEVRGPVSTLNRMKDLVVDIPLNNRRSSFVETLRPNIQDTDIDLSGSVVVQVEISSAEMTKQFDAVPVVVRGVSRKATATPTEARVLVSGAESDLLSLESRVQVVLSAQGLSRGRYRLRGEVDLPSGLKLLSIEPSTFLVELQ